MAMAGRGRRYPVITQAKRLSGKKLAGEADAAGYWKTYLPGDILCKVDRLHGNIHWKQGCPILDTAVVEYLSVCPTNISIKREIKEKLKSITCDFVRPGELLERPKTGFSVPLDKWLRGL